VSNVNGVIDKLVAADLRFYVCVPWVFGGKEFMLSGDDVKRYMEDPVDVLAGICDVPREAYLGYHRDNFTAYCCALTKAGRGCRKAVAGGTLIQEPKVWLALQGNYCTTHGG